MPELPEMQALAERLESAIAGAPFAGAAPYQFAALKTVEPSPDSLVGRPVASVGRRGKFIVIEFPGPERPDRAGDPGPAVRAGGQRPRRVPRLGA